MPSSGTDTTSIAVPGTTCALLVSRAIEIATWPAWMGRVPGPATGAGAGWLTALNAMSTATAALAAARGRRWRRVKARTAARSGSSGTRRRYVDFRARPRRPSTGQEVVLDDEVEDVPADEPELDVEEALDELLDELLVLDELDELDEDFEPERESVR